MGWLVFIVFGLFTWGFGRLNKKGKSGGSAGSSSGKKSGGGKGGGSGGGKGSMILVTARVLCLFTAMCGLAGAPWPWGGTVGHTGQWVVLLPFRGLSYLVPFSPEVLATAALLGCLVLLFADAYSDRYLDRPAKNVLTLLPFMGFAAVGPLAAGTVAVVAAVNSWASDFVGMFFPGA